LLILAKKRAKIIKKWDNALLFSCNTNNTRCNFKIHSSLLIADYILSNIALMSLPRYIERVKHLLQNHVEPYSVRPQEHAIDGKSNRGSRSSCIWQCARCMLSSGERVYVIHQITKRKLPHHVFY
jgi:hypothetical protein